MDLDKLWAVAERARATTDHALAFSQRLSERRVLLHEVHARGGAGARRRRDPLLRLSRAVQVDETPRSPASVAIRHTRRSATGRLGVGRLVQREHEQIARVL